MSELSDELMSFANKIDNRLGPISGRDADALAGLLVRAAAELRIARATTMRTGEMLDKAVATLRMKHREPRPEAMVVLCEDCPQTGYPTDKTRCDECPRRRGP